LTAKYGTGYTFSTRGVMQKCVANKPVHPAKDAIMKKEFQNIASIFRFSFVVRHPHIRF
jgi:hypothetical protein